MGIHIGPGIRQTAGQLTHTGDQSLPSSKVFSHAEPCMDWQSDLPCLAQPQCGIKPAECSDVQAEMWSDWVGGMCQLYGQTQGLRSDRQSEKSVTHVSCMTFLGQRLMTRSSCLSIVQRKSSTCSTSVGSIQLHVHISLAQQIVSRQPTGKAVGW